TRRREKKNNLYKGYAIKPLQWGRRVHSAKRAEVICEDLLRRLASMGSPSSLGEESRPARQVPRAERASMGSPSSLGEECPKRTCRRSRSAGFNGVAEFTRRRAGEHFDGHRALR